MKKSKNQINYYVNGIRTIAPPPLRKIAPPRLGFGFGSRLRLIFGLGGNQTFAPNKNCPPVRVRGWVRLVLGIGGNFPWGNRILEYETITS